MRMPVVLVAELSPSKEGNYVAHEFGLRELLDSSKR